MVGVPDDETSLSRVRPNGAAYRYCPMKIHGPLEGGGGTETVVPAIEKNGPGSFDQKLLGWAARPCGLSLRC